MFNVNLLLSISILLIAGLTGIVMFYSRRLKHLIFSLEEANKTLTEMDEQAKLIIRIDMELNKTQEELNKKVASLYILQKISQAITTTLEEEEIFKLIEPAYLEEIGFSKALVFIWSAEQKTFINYLNLGYSVEDFTFIKSYLEKNYEKYLELINKKNYISLDKNEEEIKKIFKVLEFVFFPIIVEEKSCGFLFVGTDTLHPISEGDKELIIILGTQITQALKNAYLFTELWQTQQSLEKKITERTQQLTQALEDLKKISRRKTDFIWSVAHELRTPLTSIKGYTSILLSEKLGKIPEEAYKRLEKINHHTDSLIELVNSLLDIARIEAGKVVMHLEVFSLKEIAQKVVEFLLPQFREKDITVSVDIKEQEMVLIDPAQIERVFMNLLSNALKFTPPQGKITIRTKDFDQTNIQVDISDTGCGIPEEAQELIFEEFYRVDNPINQQVKGTGLGLSLVKKIIESHKGEIWVKSKLGEGSTFSFTLPKAM